MEELLRLQFTSLYSHINPIEAIKNWARKGDYGALHYEAKNILYAPCLFYITSKTGSYVYCVQF